MGVPLKQLSGLKVKCSRCVTGLSSCKNVHRCKLLVVGGGTGGCSVAWRFSRKLKHNEIIVLEPSQYHYYQPLFTMVAAGVKKPNDSKKLTGSVLPKTVTWLKDHAEVFDPGSNSVYTACGDRICYDFMVVAVGLKNNYDKIPGLKQALNNQSSSVSTIYSPELCLKTWRCLQKLQGGHALFTFPGKGAKCSGAAQKIMYLADDYLRQRSIRELTSMTYMTGNEEIFGVRKYATALRDVAAKRQIVVNCRWELKEVTPCGAVFQSHGETITLPYKFLHVTPPMSPACSLMRCQDLANESGHLDVDKYSLQHVCFPNVFGLGDCTSTPNSKTAAAVAQQSYVVEQNLLNVMAGKQPTAKYDGYGACPVLTSYNTGILAEFKYDKIPCETFPFDQSKERRLFYHINNSYLPYLYWNKLIKGIWNGPGNFRNIINPRGR